MHIWAITNQKGGVGKTTTAVNLGGILAGQGRRTLLVDLDPHGSLSTYLGIDPDLDERNVYAVFAAHSPLDRTQLLSLIHGTRFDDLDVLPSATALATLERQAGARTGLGQVLRHGLECIESSYEHVLVDCPPMLGVLMINALAACQRVIIPVQTEFLALKGLERMLSTLEMVRRSLKVGREYLIVPTMYDPRTRASKDSLSALRSSYDDHLWTDVIPIDTQFREASREGVPLASLRPQARGALAYGRLAQDLLAERQIEQQLPEAS